MSDTVSRDIPAEVKRLVRQACGFGCVICGTPVYHYDHIEEFADVKAHGPANIALLCPNHHDGKTRGMIDRETIQLSKAAAINRTRNRTGPYALPHSRTLSVEIGTCKFSATLDYDGAKYPVLWVDDRSFFTIHTVNGFITFSITVTDNGGAPQVLVDHGEIVTTTDAWDIRFEGGNLTVRSGPRDIITDLRLTNTEINVRTGHFYNGEMGFSVSPDGVLTRPRGEPGNTVRRAVTGSRDGGMAIERRSRPSSVRFAFRFRSAD
jgi:hypothetical protein